MVTSSLELNVSVTEVTSPSCPLFVTLNIKFKPNFISHRNYGQTETLTSVYFAFKMSSLYTLYLMVQIKSNFV